MGKRISLVIMFVLVLALSGCMGLLVPDQTVTKSVELDGATSAQVEFQLHSGDFKLTGGATTLMEGVFTYNLLEWEPQLTYTVEAGVGGLLVEQLGVPTSGLNFRHSDWSINLNEDVPVDLTVVLGAGTSELDLRGLSLSKVDMRMGTGDADVNFLGAWEQDVQVTLIGGIGKITVHLPEETGVRVDADGNWGNVITGGLTLDGGYYINDAFGNSDVTLFIDVQTGIGKVELVLGE